MPAEPVYVLDACAVIAFLNGEPGAEEVSRLLAGPENLCLLHALNLCEIHYDTIRRAGDRTAEDALTLLGHLGLEVYEAMPPTLWRSAGRLKATLRRVSLADCFALALALQEGGTLVTSDHHEFDPVAEAGVCPVHFIR